MFRTKFRKAALELLIYFDEKPGTWPRLDLFLERKGFVTRANFK